MLYLCCVNVEIRDEHSTPLIKYEGSLIRYCIFTVEKGVLKLSLPPTNNNNYLPLINVTPTNNNPNPIDTIKAPQYSIIDILNAISNTPNTLTRSI